MSLFNKDPKDPNSDLIAQIEALTKTVGAMQTGMESVVNSVKTLNTNQTELAQTVGGLRQGAMSPPAAKQEPAAIKPLSSYTEDELESMTDRDKYQIQEAVSQQNLAKMIKDAISPIGDQLKSVQTGTANMKGEAELQRILGEKDSSGRLLRPDMTDLLPTMVELQKDPNRANLGFSDLYVVAKNHIKSADPTKAAAIEAKHFSSDSNVQQTYGGLLSSVGQETDEPGDMSVEAAAKASLKQVVEEVGGIPSAEGTTEVH